MDRTNPDTTTIQQNVLQQYELCKLFFQEANIPFSEDYVKFNDDGLIYWMILPFEVNQVPESIGGFFKLKILILDGLELTNLPESIGKLINLTYLSMSHNCLQEVTESISKLTNLEVLNLSYNELTFIPDSILKMKNLKILDLKGNENL